MSIDEVDRGQLTHVCGCRSDAGDARPALIGAARTTSDRDARPALIGTPRMATLESVVTKLTARNNMLVEAGQVKDQVLAMTTHELRTPITSISGFADVLTAKWHELPDSDRLALVERIQQGGRRMAKLVEDLMFAITLGAGAVRIDGINVELRPILDMAVNDAGVCRPAIAVTCPAGLRVWADPDRLSQIVTNYLTNATRYGGGATAIEALHAAGWVEIRVRDRGPGVPAEFVASLFEQFSQANRATARTVCGTGLGLAIARELAQAQGGDAWYEPNHPSGATFAVRMPAAS